MEKREQLWHVATQAERLAELITDDSELKEQPLRRDVRSLGRLLGCVIREQAGRSTFDAEEQLRQLAIKHRDQEQKILSGEVDDATDQALLDEMTGLIRSMDLPRAHQMIKAFAAFFELTNLAEANHHRRRNHAALLNEETEKPGLLRATLRRMKQSGIGAEQALDWLRKIEVMPDCFIRRRVARSNPGFSVSSFSRAA